MVVRSYGEVFLLVLMLFELQASLIIYLKIETFTTMCMLYMGCMFSV